MMRMNQEAMKMVKQVTVKWKIVNYAGHLLTRVHLVAKCPEHQLMNNPFQQALTSVRLKIIC